MTIPFERILQNADQSWTFTWANAGSSSYRIVLQGVVLSTVSILSYTHKGNGFKTFPPPIEVASDSALVFSEKYKPYFYIQWYGEPLATQYLVQQLVSAVWTTLARVQESGQWLYTYQRSILLDETTDQFRVIAEDDIGNQAPPRQYTRYVVCPPLPVDAHTAISYAAGNITISAA